MKHWSNVDILERDVLEGERFFDDDHPHPAYRGSKMQDSGDDILYEVEIIPNTERVENIINPDTFKTVTETVVDILYRTWDDDNNQWDEMKMPSLLSAWGFSTIPPNKAAKAINNFARAMKGV